MSSFTTGSPWVAAATGSSRARRLPDAPSDDGRGVGRRVLRQHGGCRRRGRFRVQRSGSEQFFWTLTPDPRTLSYESLSAIRPAPHYSRLIRAAARREHLRDVHVTAEANEVVAALQV